MVKQIISEVCDSDTAIGGSVSRDQTDGRLGFRGKALAPIAINFVQRRGSRFRIERSVKTES